MIFTVLAVMLMPWLLRQSVPAGDIIILKDALVISRSDTAPRRTAFSMDPIQRSFVSGNAIAPRAGDEVAFGDTRRSWAPVSAREDQWFEHEALRNGYLAFTYSAANDEVFLLEASGHSLAIVDGELHTGDWYQTGYVRVPVIFKKGDHSILLLAQRGRVRAKLIPVSGSASLDPGDLTLPDVVAGGPFDGVASIVMHRHSITNEAGGYAIRAGIAGGRPKTTGVLHTLPMSTRKVGFGFEVPENQAPGEVDLKIELLHGNTAATSAVVDTRIVKVRVVTPEDTRRITFISDIDGSVQYYAVNPPIRGKTPAEKAGLVLSLHGASVEAVSQASSYARKNNIYIISPTNRRPYGFDWEDWGRLDALEVLRDARIRFDTDPSKTWLTGHSMGGHGTWQLGALFPDQFAAIAPSAGWISFSSYGGGATAPGSPMDAMLRRAGLSSDTLQMQRNYQMHGVYILHGDADDNVPVSEARAMREVLAKFHPDFAYYEQPGAGHWWGNACVDWVPIFEMFSRRTIAPATDMRPVDFTTPAPSISHACSWIEILQQIEPLTLSRVQCSIDKAGRKINITTKNVAGLLVKIPDASVVGNLSVEIDGTSVDVSIDGGNRNIIMSKLAGGWASGAAPPKSAKGPHRGGLFKDAFRNRVIFVTSTKGGDADNAWSVRKARYDAGVFWVRGNGSIDIISDVEFDPEKYKNRNVVLYGNADTNGAWKALLGSSPIQVGNGYIRAGDRTFDGPDHAAVFIRPRPDSDTASVGVVAGSGLVGMRLSDRLAYFLSGAGFPDFTIIGPVASAAGSADATGFNIVGAGFFNNNWDADPAFAAFR